MRRAKSLRSVCGLVKAHVGNLRDGYFGAMGIEQIDGDGAKRAAELDDLGFGGDISQARQKETDVHIRRGHPLVGAGLRHDGKASRTVGYGHEQPAVERVKDTVVRRFARHGLRATALGNGVEAHAQSVHDGNSVHTVKNGLLQIGIKHRTIPAADS